MSKVLTELVKIDDIEVPDLIYKYRDWTNVAHSSILEDQIIFFARPTSFEDLQDCKIYKRYDLLTDEQIFNKYLNYSLKINLNWTPQQHEHFAKHWLLNSPMRNKQYLEDLKEHYFKEFDSRFGIFSLTADPTNILMWEKYSNLHTGFCVGFDAHKLFHFLGGGGKVEYYNTLPDIIPTAGFEEHYRLQVFSKEKKWEFEKEYRTHKFYQQPADDEVRKIKVSKNCYKEIIFGSNMSVHHQSAIMTICTQNQLDVTFYIQEIDTLNDTVSIKKIP